jgi:hypothetical protein
MVPRPGRTHVTGKFLRAAIAEAHMSHGSVTTDNQEVSRRTRCLGLDVSCKYVLPDETLSILLAIVMEARKSEEGHQPEAA